jgi:hypothetical protein
VGWALVWRDVTGMSLRREQWLEMGLDNAEGWCLSDDRQGMLGFAVQDQIVRQLGEKRKEKLGR